MKKLAFFILLSLVTLGVSAQSNLKWNVNAGIGMSNWYGDDTDGTDAKFAYKVGIGLEVPFANTNIWSFQTGLNFISKGVKGDGVTDAWDVVDVTINQLYLELPLMVGARIHTASNFDLLDSVCTQYLTLAGLRERERIRLGEDGRPAFYGSFGKKTFSKKTFENIWRLR